MKDQFSRNKNISDLEARKKRRKIEQRRRKYRRRRIAFVVILLLILFAIVKSLYSFMHRQPKELAPNNNIAVWYFNEINRQNNGDYSGVDKTYLNESDKLFAAYDAAATIEQKIVPGSNHLVSADSYAYDTAEIRSYIKGEKKYEGDDKLVFLTFDDGPNNTITPQILNTLKKNKAHATFFMVGRAINESTSQVVKRVIAEGNSIAGHSFNHNYSVLYPGRTANPDAILEEVNLSIDRMQKVLGKNFKSEVFRYPGGHMSWKGTESADSRMQDIGVEWIDWNCLTGDAEPKAVRPTDPQGGVEYVNKSLNENKNTQIAVVLMHDATNKQLTADSLQSVIDYFKDHGYKFGILK